MYPDTYSTVKDDNLSCFRNSVILSVYTFSYEYKLKICTIDLQYDIIANNMAYDHFMINLFKKY